MKRSFLFVLLNILMCATAAAQAYTDTELNARIDELCKDCDINSSEQVENLLKARKFSASIYKSDIGYPIEDQYVNRIFFENKGSYDDIKGMESFLKKYIKGKTGFSKKDEAAYNAAYRVEARKTALAESETRKVTYQKQLQREEENKKAEALAIQNAAKNDEMLASSLHNFISNGKYNAHYELFESCFNTIRDWGLNPYKISEHYGIYDNPPEYRVLQYAEDFEKRNPDVKTLASNGKYNFANMDAFADSIDPIIDTDLKQAVAGFKSFIASDYYRLYKISCIANIGNRCKDLVDMLRDRETRKDNHTKEWEDSNPGFNQVDRYKIDYVYKDGVFVPEGNFKIQTVKYQNQNHSGDNFLEYTYDVTYEGVVNDGALVELSVLGKIKKWEKDYQVGKNVEPFAAVEKINRAPAVVVNEAVVKSVGEVSNNCSQAVDALKFLGKERHIFDEVSEFNKKYADNFEAFMYSYLNGEISKDSGLPQKYLQPYCNNVDL